MSHGTFHAISALRIYMKNGDNKRSSNWWGRLFEKPLSNHIVRSALRAGIMHASVNLGHVGFAANAREVSYDLSEIPLNTLPVCIELLAPKRLLEQFIREEAAHLQGTTLVMVDGIHISQLHLAEMERAVESRPHTVEYITGGEVPVTVEHVDIQNEHQVNEAAG